MTYAVPVGDLFLGAVFVGAVIRPITTPTWRTWQLSVPATGFTHSDHFHPGSN